MISAITMSTSIMIASGDFDEGEGFDPSTIDVALPIRKRKRQRGTTTRKQARTKANNIAQSEPNRYNPAASGSSVVTTPGAQDDDVMLLDDGDGWVT